jgi:hypothetical protein
MQVMHEPFVGMWASIGIHIAEGRSDYMLTRGIVLVALLPVIGIRLVARRHSGTAWLFALLLTVFSFTQYQIFWRHYRKQLIALFLVLVVIWWWDRGRRWLMTPIVGAVYLIHRPAGLFLLLVAAVWWVFLLVKRSARETRGLWWSSALALLVAWPILLSFRETLFAPVIGPFFAQIDLPTINDWFQAWGTFLTISEYFLVGGISLFLAWWGIWHAKKQRGRSVSLVAVCVLLVWVFGQRFFFQRMIGYLDVFVVIFAGIGCAYLRRGKSRKKVFVIMLCLLQIGIFSYRTYRTYRPLIEANEFAFLSQIGRQIEADAVVIVPGIDYSPRVQWWTQREVIAPWLFDLNRRGNLDEAWTTKWLAASTQQKCDALSIDYPELADRPIYLRIWSKQPPTPVDGACFVLITEGEWWSRWKKEK